MHVARGPAGLLKGLTIRMLFPPRVQTRSIPVALLCQPGTGKDTMLVRAGAYRTTATPERDKLTCTGEEHLSGYTNQTPDGAEQCLRHAATGLRTTHDNTHVDHLWRQLD